jgi:hypothetical protein
MQCFHLGCFLHSISTRCHRGAAERTRVERQPLRLSPSPMVTWPAYSFNYAPARGHPAPPDHSDWTNIFAGGSADLNRTALTADKIPDASVSPICANRALTHRSRTTSYSISSSRAGGSTSGLPALTIRPNPPPPGGLSTTWSCAATTARTKSMTLATMRFWQAMSWARSGTGLAFVTLGGFNGSDTTDMLLRNVSSRTVSQMTGEPIENRAPLAFVELASHLG